MRLWATPGRTIGLTPFELMTGRAMRLPENIAVGGEEMAPLRDKMKRYVQQLDHQLRELHHTARDQQAIKDQARKQDISHTTTLP